MITLKIYTILFSIFFSIFFSHYFVNYLIISLIIFFVNNWFLFICYSSGYSSTCLPNKSTKSQWDTDRSIHLQWDEKRLHHSQWDANKSTYPQWNWDTVNRTSHSQWYKSDHSSNCSKCLKPKRKPVVTHCDSLSRDWCTPGAMLKEPGVYTDCRSPCPRSARCQDYSCCCSASQHHKQLECCSMYRCQDLYYSCSDIRRNNSSKNKKHSPHKSEQRANSSFEDEGCYEEDCCSHSYSTKQLGYHYSSCYDQMADRCCFSNSCSREGWRSTDHLSDTTRK